MASNNVQPFLIAVVILNSLLTGCRTRTDQAKEPVGATQPADATAKKTASDGCDFAIYKPIRQSHFVQSTVKTKVQPIYPPDAVRRGIRGWIYVKILVNLEGKVERACASGNDETLRRASETAALEWKFRPFFGAASVKGAGMRGMRRYVEDSLAFHFVLDEAKETTSKAPTTVRP